MATVSCCLGESGNGFLSHHRTPANIFTARWHKATVQNKHTYKDILFMHNYVNNFPNAHNYYLFIYFLNCLFWRVSKP